MDVCATNLDWKRATESEIDFLPNCDSESPSASLLSFGTTALAFPTVTKITRDQSTDQNTLPRMTQN
jgi:hypothetical protein